MEKIMFTKYILLLRLSKLFFFPFFSVGSISELLQHLPWICSGEVLFFSMNSGDAGINHVHCCMQKFLTD
jgi:hypothetical protein